MAARPRFPDAYRRSGELGLDFSNKAD